jgi:hypothetical protein
VFRCQQQQQQQQQKQHETKEEETFVRLTRNALGGGMNHISPYYMRNSCEHGYYTLLLMYTVTKSPFIAVEHCARFFTDMPI